MQNPEFYFPHERVKSYMDLLPSKTGKNYLKTNHSKSLEMVLRAYNKWINIYSGKSINFGKKNKSQWFKPGQLGKKRK